MALQIWLPLTKDLRNQGLSNVTVTNNGATYASTGGKLGGCYNFTNQNIVVPSANFKNGFTNNQASLAAWVRVTTSHNAYAQVLVLGTQGTSWNNILFGIDINGSGYPIANASTGSAYTNLSFGTAIKDGVWHHIVYTYNAGTMRVYLDGVQKATTTTSNTPAWTSSTNLYIGGNSGGEKFQNGDSINDVRLYDHCLTPEEVKRIAQGLVLHYPLNRNGWGQENLVIGSNTDSTSTNKWYHSNAVGGTSREIVMDNGIPCLKIIRDSTAQSSWHYFSYQGLLVNKIKTNTTYTISFDLKPSVNGSVSMSAFMNGNATNSMSASSQTIQGNLVANQWNHVVLKTTTFDSFSDITVSGQVVYMSLSSSLRAANTWVMMKNIHVEEGVIETPWIPASSDDLYTAMGLNSTTEYDCSGFCNNGTRSGTFSWTSDTPKYSVSQYFNGSSYSKTDSGTFSWFAFDKCTVAIWMKPTTLPSSWAGTFGIAHDNSSTNKSFVIGNYGGKFTVQSANGSWVNIQASNLPIDEWHHCVATLDGTTIKMYIDGELVKTDTINWGTTTVASDTRVQVGIDLPGSDEIYQGYYSDARIYATALSATDVKSLYQNCATIGPDGTIYGQIRS